MKTVAILPNGIKVIITDKSDARNVAMFSEAFEKLNK